MERFRAKGRSAIIFGATGNIGPAIVRKFYREGASVAVHYNRNREVAEDLVEEARKFYREKGLDAKASAFSANLSERKSVAKARSDVLNEFGSYYYSLHFQDFSIDPRLWNLKDARHRDSKFVKGTRHLPYEIAYVGTVNAIEEFAPHMMERREGSILVVGSSAAFDYYQHGEYYTAAKTAIAQLVPQYALSLGRYGVRINGGAWGWVPKGREDGKEMELEARSIPLWRHGVDRPEAKYGTPQLIAEAAFAAANLEFMTGQYILVDGGQASSILWIPDKRNVEFLRRTGFKRRYRIQSKILGKTI